MSRARLVGVAVTGLIALAAVAWPVGAEALTDLVLPDAGCPMAHCDPRMSDNVNATAPIDPSTQVVFVDPVPEGAGFGLGCSSNLEVVACSLRSHRSPNLVVYDGDGNRIFTSGRSLGRTAAFSAPIVEASGGVIAADDRTLIRYRSDGTILWRSSTVGGAPYSPVVTANGAVVLATINGPISAYSAATGARLGAITLASSHRGNFSTRNTPAVNGNRLYVSLALEQSGLKLGRLVAIDVDPANAEAPLQEKWHFDFVGPSGATPLFLDGTVYFDGSGGPFGVVGGPRLFAVRDLGETSALLWQRHMPGRMVASPAQDPRGGVWVFALGLEDLMRLDPLTGAVLQRLDLNALVDARGTQVPASAMSIARSPDGAPVMLLSATSSVNSFGPSFVVALDLENSRLLWRVEIAEWYLDNMVASQFPIVLNRRGQPRVVFPGARGGVFFVGVP